ncbi:MAG: Eco57I restriction-modification methylase domain-containing protein [Elusimicrobia bacterium]|nr:Eco57I restriction-modification methylase domain-containing protein [Candidatus Liberimonas magnetica]
MSREILQNIIDNFDIQRLKRFFSEKNGKFRPKEESYDFYNTDNFFGGLKLGELHLDDGTLLVCAFEAKQELSERSGKKAQYELGKKILKETQTDAGIFIYYNKVGSFRFSLIYANYLGKKRDWSAFRRFTYFVGNDFTNKTFKQRIGDGDFSSLEKIKDAFSVEKVTKEFYEDIANWYFWAVKHSTFPKDAEEEENGRNIAVIRLITRMIFIWFMRERGLVPKDLFDNKKIAERLKDLSPDESTYYKAILQNLFFATLSTPKDQRKFTDKKRFGKGYNEDFGNHSLFRYHECFTDQDKLKDYFNEIPFLNGGLFECLDNKEERIYIDGFSRTKKNQPNVPNFLFFSGEQKADLNNAYGTKNQTYKVRGLLDILSSFNFTIDENSPDDQDIALDPELLGRVFENLLASFNPETSTTARKATGSYYTPREIVDYMVTESLKAYFKTHLSAIPDLDDKIVRLFSTGSEENPFNKAESKKLVELIESVRIVDPAVGSGAFPMGALNKLVFILNKVDPCNELWKQAQLSAADTIPDSRIKQDTKNRIEEFFKGKNADYGRKLYLIQKCIYGVDIQQIAVEIAKLRFFISLLVDEGIDKTKENWDIEPLPNLDFKIMQGNSLLEEYEGVKLFDEKLITSNDFDKQKLIESIKQKQSELQKEYLDLHAKNKLTKIKQAGLNEELKKLDKQLKGLDKQDIKAEETAGLFDGQNEAKQKREMLKQLHKELFETNEKEAKGKIKKQIDKIGWDFIEATLKEQNKISELKKIEQFKKSNTKPFFLWKLHFADVFENGGFDIVIGNPPYGARFSAPEKQVFLRQYHHQDYQLDSYLLFLERGFDLLHTAAVLAYIIPNPWLINLKLRKIRCFLFGQQSVREIIHYARKVFDATVDTEVVIVSKEIPKNNRVLVRLVTDAGSSIDRFVEQQKWASTGGDPVNIFVDSNQEALIEKIRAESVRLKELCEVLAGMSPYEVGKGTPRQTRSDLNKRIYDADHKKDKTYRPLLRGRDIDRYVTKWDGHRWIKYGPNLAAPRRVETFDAAEKIVIRQTGDSLIATLDSKQFICMKNMHTITQRNKTYDLKFILGLLNSRLLNYYFQWLNPEKGEALAEIKKEHVENLVIKATSEKQRNQIIEIVDKILVVTKFNDYMENPTKKEEVKEYEKQIDQMVYKLYGLTKEEIKIVEDGTE